MVEAFQQINDPTPESVPAADHWFAVEKVPQTTGLGPKELLDQWLGVPLPVTDEHIIHRHIKNQAGTHVKLEQLQAIWVQTGAAIQALRAAGKTELADHWASTLKTQQDQASYLVFSPDDLKELDQGPSNNVVQGNFGSPEQER